jgi:hypothetical protein
MENMEDLYLTEECSGRKRKAKYIDCAHCGKSFLTRIDQPDKYCSRKCSALSNRNRVELPCDYCNEVFECKVSRLKNSKSGLHFCSRECKEKAQSLDGGFEEIQPEHYGTGTPRYRERAFQKYGIRCKDCDEERRYLLTVHHKDGNRENGSDDNLEVLCMNCHGKRHLKLVDGSWVFAPAFLTPRELLLGL